MRIAVLYNRDIYALQALALLLPRLLTHDITLFHSLGVGRPNSDVAALAELQSLERSLYQACSQPIDDRGLAGSLQAHLQACDIQDQLLDDINQAAGLSRLATAAPDLVLSIRFGKILRDAAIAIPRLGVVNLHSGILPDYRGVMATFWAMLHGEKVLGTTVHRIEDSSIDTGAILSRTSEPMDPSRPYLWHVWQLYEAGVANLLATVSSLDAGIAPSYLRQQDTRAGNYYSYPDDQAMSTFLAQGLALWDDSTVEAVATALGIQR